MQAHDPRTWPKADQITLLLWATIGAVAGIVLGYALGASRYYTFASWLGDMERSVAWLWILMGLFVGGAVFYIRRVNR